MASTDTQQTTPAANSSSEAMAIGDVEACAQCGAVRVDRSVGWCKKCGFYPLLGTCIELIGNDLDAEAGAPAVAEPKPSALDGISHLAALTPTWVWKLLGVAMSAAVVALAGKVLTDNDTTGRLVYTLAIVIVAKIAVVTAHIWAFFYSVTESDRLGIGDLFMRPVAVWSGALRDIAQPKLWRRPALALWGIVAESVALLALGGLPWHRVWELGPAEPPRSELAESLDRVGKVDKRANHPPAKPTEARQTKDCLILGYLPAGETVDEDGETIPNFSGLVLAAEINDKLTTVGIVSDDIPEADRMRLAARMALLQQDQPVVPSSASAIWLEPVLTCRVSYTRMTPDKKFEKLKYMKLLGELSRKSK